MLYRTGADRPRLGPGAWVAPSATVSGDCELGAGANVWHGAVLRGDLAPVRVGEGANVQDGAVLHVDRGQPCVVGRDCTVGHRALLHGCVVGEGSLVGMGAVILSGAVIGAGSVVGAGALVTEGKTFPPRSLIIGSPARALREVSEEDIQKIRKNAETYRQLARDAAEAKELGMEECRM